MLFVSIILLLALCAIKLSNKSGLPSLLLFLTLGIICSQLGIQFENYHISEDFSTIALVLIMFYGGFGTNWKMGKPVIKEAVTLASLGVVATALITSLFAHYILKFNFYESLLLGSIVGSTDYASVSNILTSKNLNLKYNSASLLELESGSNDPSAYTMTFVFLSILAGNSVSILLIIIKQIGLGLGIGFLISYLVSKLLEVHNLKNDGLAIILMFAMALLTYSLTSFLSGNGYLAVYIFGIYIGNLTFKGKKDVIFFFDGLTELMGIGLFFILGLLATPSKIITNLPIAAIIMLFITFISRPISVYGLMAPFKLKNNQLLVISWAGFRGAAAIAFAIMAINSGINFSIDIYHIVFGICLLSSLIQGSLMPLITRKMNMIDDNDSVLRTFNYYVDKGDITFIKSEINQDSMLLGKSLKDVGFRGDFIIAKIIRDEKSIVPRGDVVIVQGDQIVLIGEEYFDPNAHDLIEFTVSINHEWVNKSLSDLRLPKNELILSINRNGKLIKSDGNTRLLEGDRLILFRNDE